MRTAIAASQCITPLAVLTNAVVVIEDGIITDVGTREHVQLPSDCPVRDYGDGILVPGFIDMHIHGGAGYDVMEMDAGRMAGLERHLAKHGTTSYFPTTVTAALDHTLRALEFLADQIEGAGDADSSGLRARPVGIHAEGPFISREKPGVHPLEHIRAPSLPEFGRMWEAARGHIKVMTAAPELPGCEELIQEATKRGVCISLGHSNATLDETRKGIAAGARHATHTFNAMRVLNHREPGIIGCVLTDERISAEIIVDGVHVAPEVVRLFLTQKGPERAVLVTDALSATGMPDGTYQLGGFVVEVKGNRCLSEGKLAGSVLTLEVAVRNVMQFGGWSLDQAVRLATLNPARTLDISNRKGAIVPGADADLVVLSPDGGVITTIVAGLE